MNQLRNVDDLTAYLKSRGYSGRWGWIGADLMIGESDQETAAERVRLVFKAPWPSLG